MRFSGKRLASGYLSVNKSQLQQLPICIPDTSCPLQRKIIATAGRREQAKDLSVQRPLDEQLDQLVLELYRVSPDELTAHLDHG